MVLFASEDWFAIFLICQVTQMVYLNQSFQRKKKQTLFFVNKTVTKICYLQSKKVGNVNNLITITVNAPDW